MITEINALKDITEHTYIIFKHSLTCPISQHAKKIVEEYSAKHEELPIYLNVVQTHEQLKHIIADTYGVKHETPQIIVVKDDKMVASASHYNIEKLEQYF